MLDIAKAASTRATCPRRSVGAVIVNNNKMIVSTGYNGSLSGTPHCNCIIEDNHCVRTIHAETNAILQAARNGVKIEGTTIYITDAPCFNCLKNIIAAGIGEIYYDRSYTQDTSDGLRKLGVKDYYVKQNKEEGYTRVFIGRCKNINEIFGD